jgi:hypothetical protein
MDMQQWLAAHMQHRCTTPQVCRCIQEVQDELKELPCDSTGDGMSDTMVDTMSDTMSDTKGMFMSGTMSE